MIIRKAAYNYYAQQDIPENIFDILFNHTRSSSSNADLSQDQAMKEKDEIYQLLWKIIENNKQKSCLESNGFLVPFDFHRLLFNLFVLDFQAQR